MKKVLSCCLFILCSFQVVSEDIELYIGEVSQKTGARPQILIIFDNSGSMSTKVDVKESYDPNKSYGSGGFSTDFVYYRVGTGQEIPEPDDSSEERRFEEVLNSCETAREQLKTVGFYTGFVRRYTYSGETGSWSPLPETDNRNKKDRSRSIVVDCLDDITLLNDKNSQWRNGGSFNGLPAGYPADGLGSKTNKIFYTDDISKSNTKIGSGDSVTLYSQNYLRWYHNAPTVKKERIQIAKETMVNLIQSAPGVDFGLEIFNVNRGSDFVRDGGRIVSGIQEMTTAAQTSLINTIKNLSADTYTPLCESLYEASRYFGGKAVYFGDDDSDYSNWYTGNSPNRDLTIETSKVYKAPYNNCSDRVYVIMITDGQPTRDAAANDLISKIPNIGAKYDGSYLPALAEWMNNKDINPTMDGDQHSTLFTVGFGKDAVDKAGKLLNEAAVKGGGKYYPAEDANNLLTSLQSALLEILRVNSSFTSPSVASDNFDRTRTLDSVYYTMFLPDLGPRWKGNLKKLKLKDDKQVDREGKSAINSAGNLDDSAKTFWSTGNSDGNDVNKGGITEMFSSITKRTIYSDFGSAKTLTLVKDSPVSDEDLATHMDVPKADLDTYLSWAAGVDVDDEDQDSSTTDNRHDIFGDPLHSKPLVLNYGGSKDSQDVRILVGTNSGVLHMLDDNGATVEESWAFMPYEFFPNIKTLRTNDSKTHKVYGVDGSPTAYIVDSNGDGTIGSSDTAWVFFGLRRGGSSYYALDVSVKDSPKLKWKIDTSNTDFKRLGQTWSRPTVAHIKNPGTGAITPVVIFGGGYSISKDADGVGNKDSVGNAIYIVNADTGALIWSASEDPKSTKNTQVAFTDSIPSRIAVMDSNFDGLADRMYFGDTGANVWRVDMPDQNPFDTKNPWTVVKIAELGSESSNADDLRFFNEPSIARSFTTVTTKDTVVDVSGNSKTTYSRAEKPFEAILIGSGDRTSPANTETDNKLFMIRDDNVITQSIETSPTSIKVSDLYSFTSNPLQGVTGTARYDLDVEVSSKKGWYIDLNGKGEKSLSSATVIAGVAYFNSFTPSDQSATTTGSNSCTLASGGGALYAVDLHDGTNVYNWRKLDIGDKVPDTPTVIISPTDPDKLLFVGVGEGEGDGVLILCPADQDCDTKPKPPCPEGEICDDPSIVSLKTMRTNLYVTEQK